jgi:membrane-bound metal-dependent hydrolase YbcI (DUF457 family)
MRTYTHGVIGYLLYAKRSRQEKTLATIGGMLPDIFLALGFIPHYLEHVTQCCMVLELHRLLHHSDVHLLTVSMHSFVIVGPLLALTYMLYKPAVPFFVGMLAHAVVDLLTHRQWAYNHFFPLPFEPIGALVSYTDMGFTIVEHAFLLLFGVWWIMQRKRRSSPLTDEPPAAAHDRQEAGHA